MVTTGPSCIPHLLLIPYRVHRNRRGNPRPTATLKSFVLCSFQVADRIFVVSVQVCQFALAYYPPGYQENVPEEKKIRECSWSLGWYHEHESAVLNCTAGEERGLRPAEQAGKRHCLGALRHFPGHRIRS